MLESLFNKAIDFQSSGRLLPIRLLFCRARVIQNQA